MQNRFFATSLRPDSGTTFGALLPILDSQGRGAARNIIQKFLASGKVGPKSPMHGGSRHAGIVFLEFLFREAVPEDPHHSSQPSRRNPHIVKGFNVLSFHRR